MKIPGGLASPVRLTCATSRISSLLLRSATPLALLFIGACQLPGSHPGDPKAAEYPAGFRTVVDPAPAGTQSESPESAPPILIRASSGLSDENARAAAARARRAYIRVHRALALPANPLSSKAPPSNSSNSPADQAQPFRLVLYATAAEYDRHARRQSGLLPQSRSRYDSRTRSLHLPAAADPADWRHEWTHAILFDRRGDLPFWLHEGLALLLEETEDLTRAARLPRRIGALRERVIRHVQGRGLADLLQERPPGALAGPTAAWLCAYLSEQGSPGDPRQPGSDLATGLRGALRTGEFAWRELFPAGLTPETPEGRRKLRADFLVWLRRAN
ncbi:MAG: hypothetical protein NXI24_04950 [bacterium]|nr:hypothetical protein [bacterium]